MRNWPALAYVEIYDSGATVDIFRSMSSRSFQMRSLLAHRDALLREFPGVRALPHWQSRKEGFIAGNTCAFQLCAGALPSTQCQLLPEQKLLPRAATV